jgi:Zn-dependent peptidase ImmA (M78 family)
MKVGDTEHLHWEANWLPAFQMQDPAESATYADVSVTVGGVVVTECVDISDSRRSFVTLPLIVVAEWIVEAWVDVLANERPPLPRDERESDGTLLMLEERVSKERERAIRLGEVDEELSLWSRRHSLRHARHGYPLPDLMLMRERAHMLVAWRPGSAGRVRFIAPPDACRVSVEKVASALRTMVDLTLERLENKSVATARVEQLRASWSAVAHRDIRPEWIAARAGIPWPRLALWFGGGTKEVLKNLGVSGARSSLDPLNLDSPVLGLLRSSDPRLTREDATTLQRIAFIARKTRCATKWLVSPPSGLFDGGEPLGEDYERGYERATRLRRVLEIPLTFPLKDLEERVSAMFGPVEDCELSDEGVDGLCAWDPAGGAVIAVNTKATMGGTTVGRRMAVAHEICHLLFHRADACPLGIVGGGWASVALEREANAFAAELLLPKEAAEKALNKRKVTLDIAMEIGSTYVVGIETTLWQLSNRLRAITKDDVERLLRFLIETQSRREPRAKRNAAR